jgi:AcrR family transcriptional regulator
LVKVDRMRRAEIGRARRARSRARILEAARVLFASRPIASVIVEDVTTQARLSKGAFYSHFRSLDELRAVVAAELSAQFEDFLDSNRLPVADPVARIAAGCAAFISEAQRDPSWGALIAHGACAFPGVASAVQERLKASLRLAQTEGRVAIFSIQVGLDLVFGIVLQAMRSASEARLSPPDVPDLVRGILRALGVRAEEADCALRRIDAAARGAGSAPRANAI